MNENWTDPPRVRMVLCSCRCGGYKAWMVERTTGAWEMLGCICHTTLPADAVLADAPTATA